MIGQRSRGVVPLPTQQPVEDGYWNAAVPSYCVVPLQQHTGSRLHSLVATDEVVREGMAIAESGSRLAVPLHAPIPGRVAALGETELLDGSRSAALAIELDGEFDRLGKTPEVHAWDDLGPDELLELIRSAGVVCSPRSTIPAHLLLKPNPLSARPVVVLDVAETEPYLTADAELAVVRAREVLTGLRIAGRILDTDDLHVVVADQYRRALRTLRRTLAELNDSTIRIHRVPHRYPANTEYQLRRAAGLRPGRDDSRDLVALSPSTAEAVHDAVAYRKPQIDRIIAVGGGAVRRPAHIRVRIGTSIADVLQECGGLTEEPARVVAGGSLTGLRVRNINAPITKGVAAIIALSHAEVNAGPEEPCVNCGGCVRACPVSLNPILLHDLILDGRREEAVEDHRLMDCTECGLCAHVCPSRIPLVTRLRAGKDAGEGEAR